MNRDCIADSLLFGYFDREIFEKEIDVEKDLNPVTGLVKPPIEFKNNSMLLENENEIEDMNIIF
jgi:hypothetical protein